MSAEPDTLEVPALTRAAALRALEVGKSYSEAIRLPPTATGVTAREVGRILLDTVTSSLRAVKRRGTAYEMDTGQFQPSKRGGATVVAIVVTRTA